MEIDVTTRKAVRRVLPTNIELNNRDKLNRTEIFVQLPDVKEAVRVYQPTPDELGMLHTIEEKERENFREFSKRFSSFKSILNIQRTATGVLTQRKLEALDRMQEIPESNIRLIHQAQACPTAEEIKLRIQDFMKRNPTTDNIPLLDMNMAGKNKTTNQDLKEVLFWLKENGHMKVAFIFRSSARVVEEWNGYFRAIVRKDFGEVYMFQVPTKIGEFEGHIQAFLFGATKVAHRTGKPFAYFEPLFLEPTWEIKPLRNASDGVVKYDGMTRKEFLENDGRISLVGAFAKWDRVVQANELCRTILSVEEIESIPQLQKAMRYFS